MSTATAEPVLWGPAEVERQPGTGRPWIIPPGGGPTVTYTRCTTYIGVLEDQFGLGKWQQRKVAEGLACSPELLLSVASLGPEPDKELDPSGTKRWRTEVDTACQAAQEMAKARSKATVGTALHRYTERLDRGERLNLDRDVPEEYRKHLRAYRAAVEGRGMRFVHIETGAVHDGLKVHGTPDRVVALPGESGLFIADLKTGSVANPLKIAMQLAVYSRCQLYDPATGERRPYDGPVSQDRGLVIALNARSAEVELLWVDLAAGWEAVQVATEVRRWRARRDLAWPHGPNPPGAASPPTLTPAAGAALLAAIEQASSPEELVDLWRAAGPAVWSPDHTARAAARKQQLRQAEERGA